MGSDEPQGRAWLVPYVPGVPARDRVDLGPAGSLEAARDRNRTTARLERGPLYRDLQRAPVVVLAVVGAVLGAASYVSAPEPRAVLLAVLALALLAWTVREMWGWRAAGRDEALERAISNEQTLAGVFAPLTRSGWTVLADRLVPGGEARMPFVLVGPAGVVVVTPTPAAGPWWVHPDGTAFLEGRAMMRWVATRMWEVHQVLDAMSVDAGPYEFTGPVYPIVAVPEEHVRRKKDRQDPGRISVHPRSIDNVPVVSYRHIAAAIGDLPAPLPREHAAGLALIAADKCPPAGIKSATPPRPRRLAIPPMLLPQRLR